MKAAGVPLYRNRNLWLLLSCYFIAVSGTVLLITIGSLVGAELAPDPALATLPVSISVIGTAAGTAIAALLMGRIGRRRGFITGALCGAGGGFIAAYGVAAENFVWFCCGAGLLGFNNAFAQQYRFAAAESVAYNQVSRAVSVILLGAIGGAFFGPLLVTEGSRWAASAYQGSLLGISVLQLVAAFLLAWLRVPATAAKNGDGEPARPLPQLVSQPAFIVAVMGGLVGYAVMTLIMTATPLSMHAGHGYSLQDTAWVIQSHTIAMFAPSLVSGWLISRFGSGRIMTLGVAACALTIACGLHGQQVMHYWWALVLLGVGWNFLYVGGTTLLVGTYRPSERFKAQAVNDFSVFGGSAAASLLAGTILQLLGWDSLLWSAVPMLTAMLLALLWLNLRVNVSSTKPA